MVDTVVAMNDRARDLLRQHGWEPGAVLGSGMEGTVLGLSTKAVAKVWHGRSRSDVHALRRFGTALGAASLAVGVPQVLELLEDGDLLITIECRVPGEPLRSDGTPAPPLADSEDVRLLGDALDVLASATVSPDLASLPILPGDRPFDPAKPFAVSLAELAHRRFQVRPELLRREVEDIDALVSAVLARLRALREVPSSLIHGDLIPANVQVRDAEVSGVLDFGFMTTLGDPQFDAAIAASVFDMYGPRARRSEDLLTQAFLTRFGHDLERYNLYRAAYALITHAVYSPDGADGHFAWCAQMLRRPEVRSAVLDPANS